MKSKCLPALGQARQKYLRTQDRPNRGCRMVRYISQPGYSACANVNAIVNISDLKEPLTEARDSDAPYDILLL